MTPAVRPDDAIGSAPELIKARYRIVDTLAQTAAAIVYAADDLEQDRRVTLTVLHGEAAADEQFTGAVRQQVQRLAKAEVVHPAVARVYGCDTTDTGALFVVSEPVAGRPLRSVLEQRGALDLRSTLRLVNQIGEALETLHPNGVVHGELRPETVFVTTTDGGIDAVKLPGLELVTAHRTATGQHFLDPSATAYLAPEQVERGETTEASDVHALGLLLRELVTGERPGATGPRPETAGDLPPAIRRIVLPFPDPRAEGDTNWWRAALLSPAGSGPTMIRPTIGGGEPSLAVNSRSRTTRHPCASVWAPHYAIVLTCSRKHHRRRLARVTRR